MPNYPFEYGPNEGRYAGDPETFHISYSQEEQVNLTRGDAEKVYVALHRWLSKPPLKNKDEVCCGTFTGAPSHEGTCNCNCHKPLPSLISDEVFEKLKEAARNMDTSHLVIEGERVSQLRQIPFRGRSSKPFDWAVWMENHNFGSDRT